MHMYLQQRHFCSTLQICKRIKYVHQQARQKQVNPTKLTWDLEQVYTQKIRLQAKYKNPLFIIFRSVLRRSHYLHNTLHIPLIQGGHPWVNTNICINYSYSESVNNNNMIYILELILRGAVQEQKHASTFLTGVGIMQANNYYTMVLNPSFNS